MKLCQLLMRLTKEEGASSAMLKYKTINWLEQRWTTRSLMALNENDIRARTSQVNQVTSENLNVYNAAKAERDRERANYRQIYGRRRLPSSLEKSVQRPPDLVGKWQRLLLRRDKAFRGIQRAKEERKTTFLDRMSEGRFLAMSRRERAIKKMIDEVAIEMGIELTERALDKRVEEFLGHLPMTVKRPA